MEEELEEAKKKPIGAEEEEYSFEREQEDDEFDPDVLHVSLLEEEEKLVMRVEVPENYSKETVGVHLNTTESVEVEIEAAADVSVSLDNDGEGEVKVQEIKPDDLDLKDLTDATNPKQAIKSFITQLENWISKGEGDLVKYARETGKKEIVKLASYLQKNGYLGDAYEDLVGPFKDIAKEYGLSTPSLALLKDSTKVKDSAKITDSMKGDFVELVELMRRLRKNESYDYVTPLGRILANTEDPVISMVIRELLERGYMHESMISILNNRMYLYRDVLGLDYNEVDIYCDYVYPAIKPFNLSASQVAIQSDVNLSESDFDNSNVEAMESNKTLSALISDGLDSKKMIKSMNTDENGVMEVEQDDVKTKLIAVASEDGKTAQQIKEEAEKIRSEEGDEKAIQYISEHYVPMSDAVNSLLANNNLSSLLKGLYRKRLNSEVWLSRKGKFDQVKDSILAAVNIGHKEEVSNWTGSGICISTKEISDSEFDSLVAKDAKLKGTIDIREQKLSFVLY